MFVAAFTEQYQHVMAIFNVINPDLKWEIVTNDVFNVHATRIGILFVAYISVLFLMVFRLTHRYYGPLVSINRFVREVSAGDYTVRAKIRNKDELHDLVTSLNSMAEELQARHGDYHGSAKKNAEKSSDAADQKAS
jgi:nitrate/nitrite-specific signal transduction histidine kinase